MLQTKSPVRGLKPAFFGVSLDDILRPLQTKSPVRGLKLLVAMSTPTGSIAGKLQTKSPVRGLKHNCRHDLFQHLSGELQTKSPVRGLKPVQNAIFGLTPA